MSATCMTRRRLLHGLAVLGAGAAMAACGASTQPAASAGTSEPVATEPAAAAQETVVPSPAAETASIRLVSYEGAIEKKDVVDGIVADFAAANPGIEVEYDVSPWGEYWTKIQTQAAAGSVPDLYITSVAYAWDHANSGISLDLQPLIEKDLALDDYFMEMDSGSLRYPDMQNGDYYAFGYQWVGAALFYNKDIFDAAGAEYPNEDWTYDDMLTTAKALTKVSGDKTEIYGMDAPDDYTCLDSLIKANGGSVLSADYRQCLLTEQTAVDSIAWCVDTILKDKVAPSPAVSQGFAEGTFASKVVGMGIYGSWSMDSWQKTEFAWDISYIPKGTQSRVMYAGPDALAIAKTSKAKDAAWALFRYLISEDVQGYLLAPGNFPFNKAAANSDAFISKQGGHDVTTIYDQVGVAKGADFGPGWMEWRDAMAAELQKAYVGERSVEESITAACASIDQILSKIQWPA